MRLFYGAVETVLGLIGVVIFIPCVISLAAAVTWLVVRFSPGTKEKPSDAPS
jgi:hypothetical protein